MTTLKVVVVIGLLVLAVVGPAIGTRNRSAGSENHPSRKGRMYE